MWDGVVTAAAVVQQVVAFDAAGLISLIREAARTAQQNKQDCENLARRAAALQEVLPRLQERDPEAMRQLAGLGDALLEAHRLVVSCQARGPASRFFSAHRLERKFRDVERKIDSYLSIVPVISHVSILGRLDSTSSSSHFPRSWSESSSRLDGSTSGSSSVYSRSWSQPLPRADDEAGVTFTLKEIRAATDNFAVVLGAGDCGTVYKGRLRDGREVAVKRLKSTGRRDAEYGFLTECTILAPLRHHHILRLVGSCADAGERVVVTEYMRGGSLYNHLSGDTPSPVTTSWRARVQVLLGAACAVEHLHRHAVPLIIHTNVTSSNILLDAASAAWAPRLSGFGASVWRAAGVESQPAEVAAADGYADPEYCSTGRLKPASDVYGLGVVMLEVLTGKAPVVRVWDDGKGAIVPVTLAPYALPSIKGGRLLDVLDRRPVSNPTTWQLEPLELVANMAARCLLLCADNRPPIAEVVANLERALNLICSRGHF